MEADTQEGDALARVFAQDGVQAHQLRIAEHRSDFAQDNQPAADHDRLDQLDRYALEHRQRIDIRIRSDVDAQRVKHRLHLAHQHAGPDQPCPKSRAQHEDVVRYGQAVHQGADAADDSDAVVVRTGRAPAVDQLLLKVDITELQLQIAAQQVNQRRETMSVHRQQGHDLPAEDIQIEALQLRRTLLHQRHIRQAQRLFRHPSTSLLAISRSLVMMGRRISTVVPMPGIE